MTFLAHDIHNFDYFNSVREIAGELLLRNNIILQKQQFVKVISFQNFSSLNSKLTQSIHLMQQLELLIVLGEIPGFSGFSNSFK